MKRIALVIGHPIAGSLNHALAGRYADSARAAGADVRVIDLAAEGRELPQAPCPLVHGRQDPGCHAVRPGAVEHAGKATEVAGDGVGAGRQGRGYRPLISRSSDSRKCSLSSGR